LGQQQLLLILLSIIIVGIAIVVGINVFSASAAESKRDSVKNELLHLGGMAQQYYKTPSVYGGGERKFINWEIPTTLRSTANGSYRANVSDQQVVLIGVGNEIVAGGDSVEVHMLITPNNYVVQIIN